jgi:hypothetical protein
MERIRMEFRIWVGVCFAGGVLHRQLVAQMEREATKIGPEEIGLTLEEARTVLNRVRAGVIHRQVEASCRRFLRCRCQGGKRVTVWPLNGRQTSGTPDLQYLYADWSSKVLYRRAAAVLEELLSRGRVSHATLRHTLKVGARLQQRVIEPSDYDWPESRREPVRAEKSLSVAIDGATFGLTERCGCGNIRSWLVGWRAHPSSPVPLVLY